MPPGVQICRIHTQYNHEASDEDDDIDWPAQSDGSDSSPSVNEFLGQDVLSEVESASAGSPSVSRHSSAYELPRFGLDSDLSEPDFMGVGETDDSHRDSESDGDLSNVQELDLEDDDVQEIPNPPQLPLVSEERLQEAWPLGDAAFGIFMCPITHDVMTDPVVCADGYTYERAAIGRWFETSRKSPVTGQSLPHVDLVPNQSVRTLLKTLIDMTEGKVACAGRSGIHTSSADDAKEPQLPVIPRPLPEDLSGDEKPCLCRRPPSSVDTETDLVRGSSSGSSSDSSGPRGEGRRGSSDSRPHC